MAKMSQKELLEEGFSDKIRGIAKAAGAGLKQAAAQGVRLDTGTLAKKMGGAYKDEQPIAVLKKALAKSKDIDIVKINKGGIKKQQASAKKGYVGRIVGPKSITLIPFEGVLLGKAQQPDARQYEGPSAGAIKEAFGRFLAFPPEDAEVVGMDRDETGGYEAVDEGGRVETQIIDLLIKNGVGKEEAKALGTYAGHVRSDILNMIKETHPQIKFTYNPKSEMGTVDVEEKGSAEIQPGDIREPGDVKNRDIRENISLSLRDIIQLSREVLIIEANEKRDELRRRAAKLGIKGRTGMKIGELEAAIAEAEKRKVAADETDEIEKRFKERNPEVAEPEPAAEQPAAASGAPKTVDEWIEYVKAGGSDNLEARIVEVKKSGMNTKEIMAVLNAVPKPKQKSPEDMVYPEGGDHKKFLATLDDKVVLDLVKLKQKIQPGLQIEFEGEKKEGEASDFQGEEGMFVAEIFRTKEGLQVGDIYREGDPTAIVWSGGSARKEKEKGKETGASPFDEVVAKLTAENQLNVQMLVPRLQQHRLLKSNKKILSLTADIIKKYTGRSDDKLQEVDIKKIKAGLIKDRIIAEGTSQKNLLRQLTLLSG